MAAFDMEHTRGIRFSPDDVADRAESCVRPCLAELVDSIPAAEQNAIAAVLEGTEHIRERGQYRVQIVVVGDSPA